MFRCQQSVNGSFPILEVGAVCARILLLYSGVIAIDVDLHLRSTDEQSATALDNGDAQPRPAASVE